MLVDTRSGEISNVSARTGVFAGSAALALGLLGASPALAQSCGDVTLQGPTTWVGAIQPIATGLSGGLAISSAVAAANTAFLTESSAFVGAPANPKPSSEGSGIWIRGVGGELTLKSSTSIGASITIPVNPRLVPDGASTGSTSCSAKFQQTFGGFQLGHDVARLNVGGWNLTLGTTAGFLETSGHMVGGNVTGGAFNSNTQAPFVGTYGVATYGNFFINGLLRYDYFQTSLDSPGVNFFNQKVDAHGFTAAASAGYSWKIPNSAWFIEPSAGVIWSRESVDQLNTANPVAGTGTVPTGDYAFTPGNFSGTAQLNTIESIIGRAGVRVGTTVETANVVYQPFAAASVWHDFASSLTANYSSCPNCFFAFNGSGPVASTLSASLNTSNIGTFGQYSLGVSALIKDTGWLGFARVDYREGSEMRAISGTGGLRYQFTPTEAAGVMPLKGKAPADHPVDWTGLYVGGIGGATEFGRAATTFPAHDYTYNQANQFFPGSTANMRPSGWLGGGTLGYNFQANRWVLGVEGDFAATNANGSAPCAPLAGGPLGAFNDADASQFTTQAPLFQTTCHDRLNWMATATARIGYAWTPRTLLYVKAGGAWADEELSWTCNLGPGNGSDHVSGQNCANSSNVVSNGASVRNTRVGWTVGYGTEFALTDRWSIKGEFDWIDFGTKSLTWSDGTAVNSSLRTAEGKIGVNYKLFGP